MSETQAQLTAEERARLRELAREAIAHRLLHGDPFNTAAERYPERLRLKQASFVTLYLAEKLRGCIGSLSALKPLAEDVAHNAQAAAFKDPRFPALAREEFTELEIHLSVLSPTRELSIHSRQQLLESLRPGIDGVVLEEGRQHATYLPSVWEQLTDAEQFIAHLRMKAGLDPHGWSSETRISIYTVEEF